MTDEHRIIRVTLDTNILQELWRNQDKVEMVTKLLALADTGYLDLAVTTRIDYDTPNQPLSERLTDMPQLGIRIVGSPLRLGYSRYGSEDMLTDGSYGDVQDDIETALRVRSLKKPETADLDRIFGHHIAERDVFLSWDRAMLRAADLFHNKLAVRIKSPEDFIVDFGE